MNRTDLISQLRTWIIAREAPSGGPSRVYIERLHGAKLLNSYIAHYAAHEHRGQGHQYVSSVSEDSASLDDFLYRTRGTHSPEWMEHETPICPAMVRTYRERW